VVVDTAEALRDPRGREKPRDLRASGRATARDQFRFKKINAPMSECGSNGRVDFTAMAIE
jgi:hypothetical protein